MNSPILSNEQFDYLSQFLDSTEFRVEEELRPLITKNRSKYTKGELANKIALEVRDGSLLLEDVLTVWCSRPRTWFTFLCGSHVKRPKLGDMEGLLVEEPSEGWHGPLATEDGTVHWYIWVKMIVKWSVTNGVPTKGYVPWYAFAELTGADLAIHWNGGTEGDDSVPDKNHWLPFWLFLPSAMRSLCDHVGGDWERPNIYKLILREMWLRYYHSEDYQWNHNKIHANSGGVFLNARSRGSEINLRGLGVLTRKISGVALEAAAKVIKGAGLDSSSLTSDDAMAKMDLKVTETLIKEWGTEAYECEIFELKPKKKELFKANSHLGNAPKGQNSFLHFMTYKGSGYSRRALDFLRHERARSEAGKARK